MEKSSDALRTISEVSKEIDVPKHVLRFWENKFTQIKPMKRGGGRRYYRPSDVVLLNGIRHLLYEEGFTIRGVQQIFKREGVDFVKNVTTSKQTTTTSTKKKSTDKKIKTTGKSQTSSTSKQRAEIAAQLIHEINMCREIIMR